MSAAFLGEKEKNLTTMGLDDDGYRYNRHRDRSERFDLSSKLTEFYPFVSIVSTFWGGSGEERAREREVVEDCGEDKLAEEQSDVYVIAVNVCVRSLRGERVLVSALLPAIGGDLELSDGQGALLTTLFTVVYSLCLPLIGLAADKTNRKNLLAAGAAIWTAGTVMTANANTFTELVVARIVFAIGNGPQNPIAFSLLPELFRGIKTRR